MRSSLPSNKARAWAHPEKNEFAIAEEVTLRSGHERRPDLVIYLNGIAVSVIELKRSSVEVADGVRQLITNQEEIFNKGFFSTVQLVFAGPWPPKPGASDHIYNCYPPCSAIGRLDHGARNSRPFRTAAGRASMRCSEQTAANAVSEVR